MVTKEITKAPQRLDRGAACTSKDGVAYFTPFKSHRVFKYELDCGKCTELPPCPQTNFGLAIIGGLVTAIGGEVTDVDDTEKISHTDRLVSYNGTHWLELYPPMPTERSRPAVVTSSDRTSVVAAGGINDEGDWGSDVVEHFNTETHEWTSLAPMPMRLPGISAALCGDQLYLLNWDDSVYTCSLQALLSHSPLLCPGFETAAASQVLWRSLLPVPTLWSTPVSVGDQLVVVGGHTRPTSTNAVHLYQEGQWKCIGRMKLSRRDSIVVSPREGVIMVVGGLDPEPTDDIEILSVSS